MSLWCTWERLGVPVVYLGDVLALALHKAAQEPRLGVLTHEQVLVHVQKGGPLHILPVVLHDASNTTGADTQRK